MTKFDVVDLSKNWNFELIAFVVAWVVVAAFLMTAIITGIIAVWSPPPLHGKLGGTAGITGGVGIVGLLICAFWTAER